MATFLGFVSAEGNNGASATLDLSALDSGSGLQDGDVVYTASNVRTGADETMTMVTSGYTKLADLYADDDNDTNMGVFRKVMGAMPDTSAECANPAASVNMIAVAVAWRDVDDTTPEDVAVVTATGVNSGIPNPGAITTVTDGAEVMIFGASTVGDSAVTAPTGYSNGNAAANAAGSVNIAMASKTIATAGAEDPGSWTDWASAGSRSWCAVTIALRPAAGGGGGGDFNAAFAQGSNIVMTP